MVAATTAPVAIAVGATVQVPTGGGSGTFVNDSSTPIQLSPVNPMQGPPTIVYPNGCTPWPAGVTCYATNPAGSLIPALGTWIPGVTLYAAGDTSNAGIAGAVTGVNGVTTALCAADSQVGLPVSGTPLPTQFTILSWGWVVQPAMGEWPGSAGGASVNVQTDAGDSDPSSIIDSIGAQEGASYRLNGIPVNLTPFSGSVHFALGLFFYNASSTTVQFFLNYYNAVGAEVA